MAGEVTREWSGSAGQMRGTIREINRFDWQDIGPYKLGIKPFEGEHLLSEALTAQYASVHEKTEAVDGREAYVIDVESPVKPAYFARMWIDRQRGMPLRIEYYDKHPTSAETRPMSKVEGIKLHQTANGGWIPVAGTRSLHFSGPSPRVAYEKVAVDVDSITIRRADIPESMFTIDFPEGTAVHNAITGWTYLHGKPVKTYEQIVQSGDKFIAGTVVDERGVPVPEVVVKIYFRTTKTADGKIIKSFKIVQPHDLLNAMTDAQGRFAIEMDEDGKYDLRFLPPNHAAVIAYDVPVGTDDLKVMLPQGGTVRGRVVRMENGKKAPLGFVEVKIADKNSRSVYTTLRRYRDRKTVTDAQGRFRFDHLRTKMRAFGSKALENEEQYTRRFWTISSEGVSRDIAFYEDMIIEGLELIVEPDWDHPAPLTGKPLPALNGIQIDFDRAQAKGKSVLICFWDKDQRPSRRCITELAKKTDELKNKGITLVGVHASKVDENVLKNWLAENKIIFPVGAITGDVEETLFKWGVRSQPWLILTDADHIVRAEGFGIEELDRKPGVRFARDTNDQDILNKMRSLDKTFLEAYTLVVHVQASAATRFNQYEQGQKLTKITVTSHEGAIAVEREISYTKVPAYRKNKKTPATDMDYRPDGKLIVWRHTRERSLIESDFQGHQSELMCFLVSPDGQITTHQGNPSFDFHRPSDMKRYLKFFWLPIWATGRGFANSLSKVTDVRQAQDGLISFRASGFLDPRIQGTWQMLVDPNAAYLVRSASFTPNGSSKPGVVCTTSGTKWFNTYCLAERANIGDDATIQQYKPEPDMDLLADFRRILRGQLPTGTRVYDWRADPKKVFTYIVSEVPMSEKDILFVVAGRANFKPSLVGKSLPELKPLGTELKAVDVNNKMVLFCFFDYQQRPSRHYIRELAQKAEELKNQGIVVVVVHTSKVDESVLKNWLTENKIPYPVGTIAGDVKETLFKWGVRSQPWPILTDADHIVRAEGFPLPELDEKIKAIRQK